MAPTSSRYHRSSWGSAARVEPGLTRIRLKNPRGHLMINTYVWREDDVLLIVDPGWPWTLDALQEALRELELGSIEAATHWLYTHTHIDHMGSAALLAARSLAPHLARAGIEPVRHTWHSFQDRMNDWSGWANEALPRQISEGVRTNQKKREERGETMCAAFGEGRLERLELFEVGEVLRVGSLELHVHEAGGHDPLHVAFFEPARGWLFCGDAVLAVPTPISPPMDDDVALYESSLAHLLTLPATHLLPGHGTHMEGRDEITAAIARSQQFVKMHRASILAALSALTSPIDLHALALTLTPRGEPLAPSARWWVLIATTDAHLAQLCDQGRVRRHDDADGPRYSLLS